MRQLLVILLLSFLSGFIQAQKLVNNFSLIDAVSGKSISLSDFQQSKLIAVVFMSNKCPYSNYYTERLVNLQKTYRSKGIQLVLINSNDPEVSSMESSNNMKEVAVKGNFDFPYLADPSQRVSRMFNAQKNPEVFLLRSKGDQYQVIYQGAIDNNPQNESDVTRPHLVNAIELTLIDQPLGESYIRPVGCRIKQK